MKRIVMSALFLVLAASVSTTLAQEKKMEKAPAHKETTLKGEVVDLACYIHQGAGGEDHRDCAIACAKAGGALGILADDGTLYISLLPDNHKEGPNAKLIDHAAHQVEVKGYVREKGGVKGIMITSVTMAAKEMKMEKKY